MKDSLIFYSVGALLYCPANNETISKSILRERFGTKYSLALCLEDTIRDDCVKDAEQKLLLSLNAVYAEMEKRDFYLPKIFIRVRCPEQINALYRQAGNSARLLTGFIAPKFDLGNADSYLRAIVELNQTASKPVYLMPILESPALLHLLDRGRILYSLKEKLDAAAPYILNIRIGGNDLCHMFGFRRHDTESIHGIRPIADIFSDIITVFGMDYVVSGPVWEYYAGANWETGLARELSQDRLCGFTGKTVIHPKQISLVNAAYQVSPADYADAKAVIGWDSHSAALVSGSPSGKRMNEYKTHYNWAKTILFLSEYYGVGKGLPADACGCGNIRTNIS